MEVWKQHVEYPRIEVSNTGKVRHHKDKCPWYTRVDKLGYVVLQVKVEGVVKTLKVHRLIAQMFVENPFCYTEINHIDGDKTNNIDSNLEWCTRSHNIKESFRIGLRSNKGASNPRSKLNDELVTLVCEYFSKGYTPKEAVEKFGISKQQATKLRAKLSWKHITENYSFPKLR